MTTVLASTSQPAVLFERRDQLPLAQLSTLAEAGLSILRAPLDVDVLCELAYEHASRVVDAHSFHLGLFDKDSFVLKLWVHNGQRMPPTTFPGAQDTGIVGWMRTHQQPLLVRDFTTEMDKLPARPSYIADNPPRSAIFVPLVAGDTVVGSLSAQHPEPNRYSLNDLQSLGIIANQVASAIVNARLFQTVQRRAEQLAAIGDVSRAITAVLDLDDLLTRVVELIRERFGYYHVQVFLVEDESHRAVFRASSGHNLNKLWRQQRRSQHFGEGIIGWVAATGEYLLANDVSQEPRYIADDPRLLPDTRSELAVPLLVDGEVVGVLDVQSRQLNAFGDEDLFVLTALANQVAVAVDAAWSYRAQQEEAWITTVLLQVAEVVNRVETIDDVLGAVVRLVPMLTGVLSCGAWLKAEETQVFELAAAFGFLVPWEDPADRQRLRLTPEQAPALALVEEAMQPIELAMGDRSMLPDAFWAAVTGDQIVLLPLIVQNRSIGCLAVSLDSADTPLRIRSKRLTMLNGIANQVTTAIESVRLNTAYQEEAWTSWALLEVSQAINTAESVDAMLEQVVRLAPLLAGVNRCAVLLYDDRATEFVVAHEYSGSGTPSGRFAGLRLRLGDLPLLDLAVATRRLQRVDDTSASVLVPERWAQQVGSKTLLAIPLVTQDDVLGVLLVDDTRTSHIVSQRREDILTGIARQVALALDHFRLQAQEHEHLRMTQELQMARHIQTSLLPDVTPQVPGYAVAHAWHAAREVGGDFYDVIALKKGRWGLLMADVADKGMPAALLMATSLNTIRVAAPLQEEPKRVLSYANQHLLANNRAEMFVTAWYGVLDPARHLLTYANAGHSLAQHLTADGAIRRLRAAGMPLGIAGRPRLGQERLSLAPGDLIALYTDGITDALNSQGEEFGEARLQQLLLANRHRPAQMVVDAVIAAVLAHAGQTAVFDDLTLLVLKRNE